MFDCPFVTCYERTVTDEQDAWDTLWRGICELSGFFPEGIVFIGGIAVYLHAKAAGLPEVWIEFSHDGDFFISLSDLADLRDLEEVTANRRLSKHQLIKEGVDFDVYIEHNNLLRIPYSAAAESSIVIDKVRVASLEHLLLLKLAAYSDRRGRAKGRKDERDLIRICYILSSRKIRKALLAPYIDAKDIELMRSMVRSSEFLVLGQSVPKANHLRSTFVKVLGIVEKTT